MSPCNNDIDVDALAEIQALYRSGKYLTAYEAGKALGALTDWPTTEGRILAARLAMNLGSSRLGRVLVRRAWRQDIGSFYAAYFYALAMYGAWGPLRTWRMLRSFGDFSAESVGLRADLHGLYAHVLTVLGDQQRAQEHLDRSLELTPERPWIWVQRASILEIQDQFDEALASSLKALELQPYYRPAVQSAVGGLLDVNRDAEALQLLSEAVQTLECGDVVGLLAMLQTELGHFADARDNYERLERFYPLLEHEKLGRQRLLALRSDAAYYCGDYATAARLARESDAPFHVALADRLDASTEGHRIQLDVGFVRQRRGTCAPATLAALSQYWRVPADQATIAQEICYDGTPTHHARQWAEEQGFVVRELRVTPETATALIERGLPLTLVTVDPANAHLQAIIGYDSRRRTLLVRDPSVRTSNEYEATGFLEHYRPNGPHGMVLVPPSKAENLQGIDLPDAPLYEELYQINRQLLAHDRAEAQQAYQRMLAIDANDPLSHHARWAMARYDSDATSALAAVEALLVRFPEDVNLQLTRLSILQELGRREERLSLLKTLCETSKAHPLFKAEYAIDLSDDARSFDVAEQLLLRVVRYRPREGRWYGILANILWARGRREEAHELYRFAAGLLDKSEDQARSYFIASRHLRQTDEALRFLTQRCDQLGGLSSQPIRTLAWAYDQLSRHDDMFKTIEEAIARRPEDSELLLFAVETHARFGKYERALVLLQQAKGKSHATEWLRQAARIATYRGQHREALDHWRNLLGDQPLDLEAHSEAARLIADLQGRPQAVAQLRQAVERFPHHYRLRMLLIEWLRDEGPATQEAEVRELLLRHPDDPWAQRELAIVLLAECRWSEAAASAETACQLEPSSPVVHFIRGRILDGQGNRGEARQAMRESIRSSVDYEHAVQGLMNLCDTKSEREQALEFILSELQRQVIFGDGLLAFREHAIRTWEPETILANLQDALAARPDLWHAHAAVIKQLNALDRTELALTAAREAVKRFPLVPRLWLELASTCRLRDDMPGEIEALEEALEINPTWSEAVRSLAEAHRRQGDFNRARELIQQAIAHDPQDPLNHSMLSDIHWDLDDKPSSVEALQRAVELQPRFESAWNRLRERLGQLDRLEQAVEIARRAADLHPHEGRLWLNLSDTLDAAGKRSECLAAIERAIEAELRNVDAHSQRAYYLAAEQRWDEALAACRPPGFGAEIPLQLQSREAYVLWQHNKRDEAVKLMTDVVGQDPDYYWAWNSLAEWYDQLGNSDEYLKAAEEMVRIAPKYGIAHGYLGHAKLQRKDHAGAKESLHRSLTLASDYRFAIDTLLDLHLQDAEPDEADKLLKSSGAQFDAPARLSWEACLAVVRGNCREALDRLGEICASPLKDSTDLNRAVDMLVRRGWQSTTESELRKIMQNSQCSPLVGPVWVNLCAFEMSKGSRCARHLKQLRGRGELWHLACQFFLDPPNTVKARDLSQEGPRVLAFIRANDRWLREYPATWDAVGRALCRGGHFRRAIRWSRDWRERKDLQPRLLLQLAEAHWYQNQPDPAAEVSAQAMTMPPDSLTPCHEMLLALNDLRRGDYPSLEAKLGKHSGPDLPGTHRSLYDLLHEMVQLKAADADWKAASARLERLLRSMDAGPVGHRLIRRAVLICKWRLATDHGRRFHAIYYRLAGMVS